ncbi:MAG TPA: Hsp20/alpha crystallin family protein [Vicinamibacterales bacterium]|nr:Hsp20/alpha crystallin family protein [Vicinamibacterales bacterium]
MAQTEVRQQDSATALQQRQGHNNQQRQGANDQIARRQAYRFMSPFALLQRMLTDDIANLFDQQGSRAGGQMAGTGPSTASDMVTWSPKVDVMQRGNDLVIRADLPGVKPEDVSVEVTDDAIVMSGQRKEEHVEDWGNVYRVERTYGAFFREIPLPEGAIVDQAKASFTDGVLEVTVPAPSEQAARGRRLEINSSKQ